MNLYEIDRAFSGARVFDISPQVSESTAVFPGDQKFRREHLLQFSQGHHLDLSHIQTSLHIGAHADAPSHYSGEGRPISEVDPMRYVGHAWVARCDVTVSQARVSLNDLSRETQDWIARRNSASLQGRGWRFLLSTGTCSDSEVWNPDFASYHPSLIETLAKSGCVLVGIDTPSVDPETSKDLPSHQALFRNQLSVLEGLALEGVSEGEYFLIAQPLKIAKADASPVRALLLQF